LVVDRYCVCVCVPRAARPHPYHTNQNPRTPLGHLSLSLSLVNIQRAKKTTHGARYRKKHTRPAHEEPQTHRAQLGWGKKSKQERRRENANSPLGENWGVPIINGWWWWARTRCKTRALPTTTTKTLDLFQSKAMCVLRVCATHKARIFSLFGLSLSLSLSLL